MASIYKRGKVWWVHYLVGGKSVSRSLKTTSERVALDKKKKLEALDVIGQLGRPSSTPLATFLQSFCEFLLSTRTAKSAKNDISYLRTFFGPCCPAMELGSNVPHKFRQEKQELPRVRDKLKNRHVPVRRLEDISAEMISNFIQSRIKNDGISPKTANRSREVLSCMFSYGREYYGYICPDRRYKNPVEGVRKTKENSSAITWLKSNEIEEQLKTLKDHSVIHSMVAVYIYAGLRREEALWLTHKDVNMSNRLISVQAKTINDEFWQPKTKRNRVVPISNALFEILSEYKTRKDCIWFFPSPKGKRWHPDNFSQDLRKINKTNGLSWSCLDFRHTFGSHLAQKGESLYKISKLMGNSPEICRKHYAALIPEEMADVVEFSTQTNLRKGNEDTKIMLGQILQKLDGVEGIKTKVPNLKLVRFDDTA